MEINCPKCAWTHVITSKDIAIAAAECLVCEHVFNISPSFKIQKAKEEQLTFAEEIESIEGQLGFLKRIRADYKNDDLKVVNKIIKNEEKLLKELRDYQEIRYLEYCGNPPEEWKELPMGDYYKRPSLAQYDKVADHLDRTYGAEAWEESDEGFFLFYTTLRELCPELKI